MAKIAMTPTEQKSVNKTTARKAMDMVQRYVDSVQVLDALNDLTIEGVGQKLLDDIRDGLLAVKTAFEADQNKVLGALVMLAQKQADAEAKDAPVEPEPIGPGINP
jgi:hypothetical protein